MLPRDRLDVFRSEPARRYLQLAPVAPEEEALLAAQLAQSELARLLPWALGEGGTAPPDRWSVYAARVAEVGGRVYAVDDIYRRANPVGWVSLTPHPSGAIALEAWIAPEAWGKGFTSLIAEGVCDELLVHAKTETIVAECFIDNSAGRRVLEKVGFIETGRSERVHAGFERPAEIGLFRLSRADWVRAAVKTTPRLATERLILRPWLLEDRWALSDLVDPEVARANGLLEYPCSDSQADEFIAWAAHTARPGSAYYSWELAIELEGTLIGSLSTCMRRKDPTIGWWLGRSWRGRGFATEAARAVLPRAFEAGNLDLIRSYTGLNNLASKRVMEKLGFLVINVDECHVLTELTRKRIEAIMGGLLKREVDV